MAADIPCRIFEDTCDYRESLEFQESLRNDVIAKKSSGCVLFLEHKPVYTSGLRGREEDFIEPVGDIPVYNIRRGGELTFHGPGQLVIYPVIDLRNYRMFITEQPDTETVDLATAWWQTESEGE